MSVIQAEIYIAAYKLLSLDRKCTSAYKRFVGPPLIFHFDLKPNREEQVVVLFTCRKRREKNCCGPHSGYVTRGLILISGCRKRSARRWTCVATRSRIPGDNRRMKTGEDARDLFDFTTSSGNGA